MKALEDITRAGTSIWLDDLSQARLVDPASPHSLTRLVSEANVRGVTTNPTIFAGALGKSDLYAPAFTKLLAEGVSVEQAVTQVTANDVRLGCDVLAPVFERTGGRDGRVSIEVDPRNARDTAATIEEGRKLWHLVDRKNLFIKVPATIEGLPAIRTLISEGISVNVTLIFSLTRHEQVWTAFAQGLEDRLAAGQPISGIESVASYFVSRVDTEVDKQLAAIGTAEAAALRGRAAIANARLAYQSFLRLTASERWQRLAQAGATTQRPLWASTGVKDKAYDDTRYVVELVAADTVNTMPEATLLAVADHGIVRGDTITGTFEDAQHDLDALTKLGISYDEVVGFLERDGVEKFAASWLGLFDSVAKVMMPK